MQKYTDKRIVRLTSFHFIRNSFILLLKKLIFSINFFPYITIKNHFYIYITGDD